MIHTIIFIFASIVIPFLIIRCFVRRSGTSSNCPILVVLGSGGHTGEMLLLLEQIDYNKFFPRTYVVASSDTGPNSSSQKILQFENQKTDQLHSHSSPKWNITEIPRARELGQTSAKFYVKSAIATLKAFIHSLGIVYNSRPNMLLCNGPGTCIPVCFAAFVCNLLGLTNTRIIYVESFACVAKLSLSGFILYYLRLTDAFCVLWKDLCTKHPRSHLLSNFSDDNNLSNPVRQRKQGGYVLVTVGSTRFDELIQKLDSKYLSEILLKKGYSSIHFQIGKSQVHPCQSEIPGRFTVEEFEFKESLVDEIKGADLIISHGGAATTLEALLNKQPLILVPNENLMNNHQLQLVAKIAELGYAFSIRITENFTERLEKLDFSKLRTFSSFVEREQLNFVMNNTLNN